MADVNRLLAAFRAELVIAGLVRRPTEAPVGSPPPPPMLNEPDEGPPGPSSTIADAFGRGTYGDADLVLSLMHSSDAPPADGFAQAVGVTRIVDVVYRSANSAALRRAYALDAAIANRLVRPETNYGYGFTIAQGDGPLFLQGAQVFAGMGPISRSRVEGYRHVAKYALTTGR